MFFDTSTRSVTRTVTEIFQRKATCDPVVFLRTAWINLDVKVLRSLQNNVTVFNWKPTTTRQNARIPKETTKTGSDTKMLILLNSMQLSTGKHLLYKNKQFTYLFSNVTDMPSVKTSAKKACNEHNVMNTQNCSIFQLICIWTKCRPPVVMSKVAKRGR